MMGIYVIGGRLSLFRRLDLECRSWKSLSIAEVGIGKAAPAVADKGGSFNLGGGEKDLVAFYLDVCRIEYAIGIGNLEALGAGEAFCMIEPNANGIV